ncbi:MAG TPA: hypothetical protein VGN26_15190 [Armatimonadota bacterium]|jgi:hypothetical protein
MTACPVELLGAELDGVLDEGDVVRIQGHRQGCDACQREYDLYRALDRELAGLRGERASEALSSRVLEALTPPLPNASARRRAWTRSVSPGLRRLLAGAALVAACSAGAVVGLVYTRSAAPHKEPAPIRFPDPSRLPPSAHAVRLPEFRDEAQAHAYLGQCSRRLRDLSRRWGEVDARVKSSLGGDLRKYLGLEFLLSGVPGEERLVHRQQEDLSTLRQWLSAAQEGKAPSSAPVRAVIEREVLHLLRIRVSLAEDRVNALRRDQRTARTAGLLDRRTVLGDAKGELRRLRQDLRRFSGPLTPELVGDALRLLEEPAARLRQQTEQHRRELDRLTRELRGPEMAQRLAVLRDGNRQKAEIQRQARATRDQIDAVNLRLHPAPRTSPLRGG